MVRSHVMNIGVRLAALVFALTAMPFPASADDDVFSSIASLESPTGLSAEEPSLFSKGDGQLLMSWTEETKTGFAVRVATHQRGAWSQPQLVIDSSTLFVNWADFPSVAAFDDGTLAVHWLQETGSGYDYDVNIALSPDQGKSWSKPFAPHREAGRGQHGFATLLPMPDNTLLAVWLDGRAYDAEKHAADEMQLRATRIAANGDLSDDVLLDVRTCSCCQTSAAITEDATVLVAYRDRTDTEIRDISVVRMKDGSWSQPISVHNDGWEISGCPVNGPAIDASASSAVVAWFTEAQGNPAVKIAFSGDAGRTFGNAFRVDQGNATGRVDTVMVSDGSAIVSWVERNDDGEELLVCHAQPGAGCGAPQVITRNTAAGSIDFPRMVKSGDGIVIAWSQPGDEATIRLVFAKR